MCPIYLFLISIAGNLVTKATTKVVRDTVRLPRPPRLPQPPRASRTKSALTAGRAPIDDSDTDTNTGESEEAISDGETPHDDHTMQAQVTLAMDPNPTTARRIPQQDDIRTTYHPHSGRASEVSSFADYGHGKPAAPVVYSPMPWLPFNSESEFSFAEILLESAMSNHQIDALIDVVHKLLEHKEAFRVRNHFDLEKLWTGASDHLAPVC